MKQESNSINYESQPENTQADSYLDGMHIQENS